MLTFWSIHCSLHAIDSKFSTLNFPETLITNLNPKFSNSESTFRFKLKRDFEKCWKKCVSFFWAALRFWKYCRCIQLTNKECSRRFYISERSRDHVKRKKLDICYSSISWMIKKVEKKSHHVYSHYNSKGNGSLFVLRFPYICRNVVHFLSLSLCFSVRRTLFREPIKIPLELVV